MTHKAATVEEYLAGLPEDRRAALSAVRQVILKNLPKGMEEGIQYGHIGYYVPHSIFPAGYHCNPKEPLPYAGLGSQKNHMAVYLCNIYDEGSEEFRKAYLATGKKLDMGVGCVRFKKLEDLPLEPIGETIGKMTTEQFVAGYQAVLSQMKSRQKKK